MDIKITDRIQKLLALSESSNEHEAQAALLKAQELLMKYKLSQKDLAKPDNSNPVVHRILEVPYKKSQWRLDLATIISDNYSCYAIGLQGKYSTSKIDFLGRESDIEVCLMTFEFALHYINRQARKICSDIYKRGISTKHITNDYALGFIVGLNNQFTKNRESHEEEWGLVVLKDKEVIEEFSSLGTSDCDFTELKRSERFYEQGKKDGENFSVNALENQEFEEQLKII